MRRHARITRIYLQCAELDVELRSSYLDRACGVDSELRREVEAMLDFDRRQPSFLERGQLGSLAAEVLDTTLPEKIGKFRILRRLGEGGMGTVFEAEQESPRRTVALKVLRADVWRPRSWQRFQHEGDLLARLEHPGIARIYEAGHAETEVGTLPWLSMELVHGTPLTHWVRERAAEPRKCLELLARVCDAVQHAHERNVIHRDLKPVNILVDGSGEPRVLDFGIARATDSEERLTTHLPGAGGILGTLAYMSPEQARGDLDTVDARADVYSLGVILHELLAGELPYPISERSLQSALTNILELEPRPLGSLDRAFRGDVETIVLKALEKDLHRRYASAGELGADLRRFLRHEPIEARRPSRGYVLGKLVRRNRVVVAAASAVFLALALGLVVTTAYAYREAAHRKRADERTAEALELAYQGSILGAQTLLEAGSFDAAVGLLEAAPEHLRGWGWGSLERRLNPLLRELTVPRVWDAVFLDDTRVLIVDELGDAWEWNVLHDELVHHGSPVPDERPIALARDGRALLSWADGELLLADPLSDRPLQRTHFAGGIPGPGWRTSAIAPDERFLAVSTTDNAVWLLEPGSNAPAERIGEATTVIQNLVFSTDGRFLAVGAIRSLRLYDCEQRCLVWERHTSETLVTGLVFDLSRSTLTAAWAGGMRTFDLETGDVLERWSPFEIKTQGRAPFDLALVPGTRLLAARFNGGNAWLMDLDTREVRASILHFGFKDVSIAVAPRGETLLTCGRRDEATRLWSVVPPPAEVLAGNSASLYPLAISPDDALVATGSWDGRARLWDVRRGRPIAALPHRGRVISLSFSSDGRTLACGSPRAGLHLWDTRSGAALRRMPELEATAVAFAPDGTLLAVGHDNAIRLLDTRTFEARSVVTLGSSRLTTLAWSTDGRFIAAGTKGCDLWLHEVESGARIAHARGPSGGNNLWRGSRSIAFSPDGKTLATGWGGPPILLFGVPDLAPLGMLTGHDQEVFGVAWSPDGKRLGSGGRDNRLHLWNPATRGLLLDLESHRDYIFSLAFTHDGRRIVTGSGDGTVRVWDSVPASTRWVEKAVAERDHERLQPLVASLLSATDDPSAVADQIAALPELSEMERRTAWNLVLERTAPLSSGASAR